MKIFKIVFFLSLGMAAIWAMWPKGYEQTFVLSPHGGSTCNLLSISQAVSEEMSFENVDDTDDRPLPIL